MCYTGLMNNPKFKVGDKVEVIPGQEIREMRWKLEGGRIYTVRTVCDDPDGRPSFTLKSDFPLINNTSYNTDVMTYEQDRFRLVQSKTQSVPNINELDALILQCNQSKQALKIIAEKYPNQVTVKKSGTFDGKLIGDDGEWQLVELSRKKEFPLSSLNGMEGDNAKNWQISVSESCIDIGCNRFVVKNLIEDLKRLFSGMTPRHIENAQMVAGRYGLHLNNYFVIWEQVDQLYLALESYFKE